MQVSALWALRNFGLVETYRSKMASMGVISLVVPLLEPHAASPDVQHAAVSLLQVLTTADEHNVQAVTAANVLQRLVGFLFMKGNRCGPNNTIILSRRTGPVCVTKSGERARHKQA